MTLGVEAGDRFSVATGGQLRRNRKQSDEAPVLTIR
jgi:hypothetical protein